MTMQGTAVGADADTLAGIRQELAVRLHGLTERNGRFDSVGPVNIYRESHIAEAAHGVYRPSLCVVAQGRKLLLLGNDRFSYGPGDYLLVSAALPIAAQVIEAAGARPYLCIGLELDPALVGEVLMEAGSPTESGRSPVRALHVSPLGFDLLDAVLRIVRLLETPQHARMLIPLFMREIVYRLLADGQGCRLRQIAITGPRLPSIARAIDWLQRNFDKPMRIETLAQEAGMSTSGLHHHFKAVTAMSPLQFQKRMRLQEARRLMSAEGLNASSAAFRVGYDDPSHFSREYRRMFGAPPARDFVQTRKALAGAA